MSPDPLHVVVVGGGFAGLGCAQAARARGRRPRHAVDRNNYHQFQPLLYQVATSQLALERHRLLAAQAVPRRRRRRRQARRGDRGRSGDPHRHARRRRPLLRRRARAGRRLAAELLPHAGREEHAFPLYSLDDATRLRSRILEVFEAADRDPSLIEQGALNFVVVGGGPTGVELAGALADLIAETMTRRVPRPRGQRAQIHLVDLGHALLAPFSDSAHDYAAKVLGAQGRAAPPGRGGHRDRCRATSTLADGTAIPTRCVVWGGGHQGAAARRRRPALPQGRGGRIDVQPDLSVAGLPGRLRRRRRREHPGARRRRAPAARLGRAAERQHGRRRTSSPTPRASRATPSTTTTRASWR